jgi:hypothetical protein
MVRPRPAAVCALLVVLTGCGSTQNTSSTTPPTSTVPPAGSATSAPPTHSAEGAPQTTTPRCTATTLVGSVKPADAAAGNRYATLIVTNKSKLVCTLYGYGGLQLIAANGSPNPTNLIRTPDPGPSLVSLQPGDSAQKKLHWVVIPTGNEPVQGPCQPPSGGATVIPPDETEPFKVGYEFGSVCDGGRIEGGAYFKA